MLKKREFKWYNVAFLGFVGVWSFGNVVNNYSEQGLSVIFSWIFIMLLYFLPYALMVGELGSVYSESKSGVSGWVKNNSNATLGFLAAWTYWVVHIPYMANKPQSGVIALLWGFTMDGNFIDNIPVVLLQSVYIVIFLLFVLLALRGIRTLKVLGTIAGSMMFIMSMLYIFLGISGLIFLDIDFATTNITFKTFIPTFNFQYLTTFAMLVFAVGGIEKISPYVGEMEDGKRGFPKAIIAILIMVVISAIFGSIVMGAMFDSANIPEGLKQNGQYEAFSQLGQWYFGNGFMSTIFARIYAFTNAAAQFAVLLISIDAPLKVLLADTDSRFIPYQLQKRNKYDAPYVAYGIMSILVVTILLLPMLSAVSSGGSGASSSSVYDWLIDLNSIVMPLRYLWVFLAYILLKKSMSKGKVDADYKFVKNNRVGILIAGWCFLFTAFACTFKIIPAEGIAGNMGVFLTNLLTPLVLLGLGAFLPLIARKTNKKV